MALHPCVRCGRHVRENDVRCPFCNESAARGAFARASMLLGAGATILGCQGGNGDANTPTRTANDANGATTATTAVPNNDTIAVPAYGLPPPVPVPSAAQPATAPESTSSAKPTPTPNSRMAPAYGGPPPKVRPPG